jgi:hypothetical protein
MTKLSVRRDVITKIKDDITVFDLEIGFITKHGHRMVRVGVWTCRVSMALA